jgi:L-glyceraldehyde 3-phosphate reductase
MRFRTIKGTDLSISEIGFGCGGNAGLMIRGDESTQISTIARATELGINYFDNAPDYGDGLAEANLGRAIRALKIKPVVTTKVEIRAENLDDIAGHVMRSTEASLKRLGLEAVDILQVHNGPVGRPPHLAGSDYRHLWLHDFLRPGGALEGLQKVQQQGKARYLGFICRGGDADSVRTLLDTGAFSLINVPYNLLNPTADAKRAGLPLQPNYHGVIDEAFARNAGSAIFSPLGGGMLNDEAIRGGAAHPLARPRQRSAATDRDREMARNLLAVVADEHRSLVEAAVTFILMHPGVTTLLGGFSDQAQLEQVASVSGRGTLSPDTMARLDRLWNDTAGMGGRTTSLPGEIPSGT